MKLSLHKKNILILGGLGFLGRNLCKIMSREKAFIYAIGHNTISKNYIKNCGINKWIESSISLKSLIENFSKIQFDAIIHCAGSGSISLSYQDPIEDYQRSVTSVFSSLEFIRLSQPKKTRFVLASSAAVYGDQNILLTERSNLMPISPYGYHKLAAENICSEYSKFFRIKSSIVRFFSIYGPGLEKQLLWDASNKFKKVNYFFYGKGNEMRDWVHVEDASILLMKAALTNQADFEIYNGCNEKASTKKILKLLAKNFKKKFIPNFNNKIHIGNPKNLIGNNNKAIRELNWLPKISINEGLKSYAKWFQDEIL